jgi:hypothetical protein
VVKLTDTATDTPAHPRSRARTHTHRLRCAGEGWALFIAMWSLTGEEGEGGSVINRVGWRWRRSGGREAGEGVG